MKEDLPSLNAAPSNDPIIITRSKEIHEEFIHTVVPPNKEPEVNNTEALSQLATNMSKQTEILQQLNNLAADRRSEKSKKKGFNAIHPLFKSIILTASSTDVDLRPYGLTVRSEERRVRP